jgi:hypothetical protein
MAIYYGKRGELRLYDGGTPKKYVLITFSNMDINVPEGPGRPEDIIVLNRAQLDAAAGYIQGPDDPIVNPMQLTMSFRLDDGQPDLIHEFIALRFANGQAAAWVAGGAATALITTKGTSVGRRAGLTGSLIALPQFQDPAKKCVDIEVLWTQAAGSTGRRLTEVYFPPDQQSLNEAVDSVTVNMNGQVYGNVAQITAFSAGTQLTP